MATINRADAIRASGASRPYHREEDPGAESLSFDDLEAEIFRLSAINDNLMSDLHDDEPQSSVAADQSSPSIAVDVELLRAENIALKARIDELEALSADGADETWQDRQREYEMLLEEKSEVIRSLHQRIQEMQETVSFGESAPPAPGCSSIGFGQAEEILRLKRELDEQRRQIEQDENDMMGQMRQMEMQMAKERAEMARHRQEIQRLQSDLAREIEQSGRDGDLRERLQNLRRPQETKAVVASAAELPERPVEQKSSGFIRRLFG